MTVEQLRAARDADPFKPFTIHIAGGRSHFVPHRDFLSMTPSGRTLIVYQAGESFSIVDTLLVTELSVEGQPAAPAPVEGAA